jgi:hypothetical protein
VINLVLDKPWNWLSNQSNLVALKEGWKCLYFETKMNIMRMFTCHSETHSEELTLIILFQGQTSPFACLKKRDPCEYLSVLLELKKPFFRSRRIQTDDR